MVVTNTNDAGVGSLRQAILDANATPGLDTITFNIGTIGSQQTIQLLSTLPPIIEPVIIDGFSQGSVGYTGLPLIELSGELAGANVNGLSISAGNSTVQGLAINRFSGSGILLQEIGGNLIQNNHIGTDPSGTLDRGNSRGVTINNTPNNRLERNLISGNNSLASSGIGIEIINSNAFNNQIIDNLIGTNLAGNAAIANNIGISVRNAPQNLIQGNLISGNSGAPGSGITLAGPNASQNQIIGNRIGTDITGTVILGNVSIGISIADAPNNIIGGATPPERNLISGNEVAGISFLGAPAPLNGPPASGNLITGNYIGTDINGTTALANGIGIFLNVANNNTIGGSNPAAKNLISGNNLGIYLNSNQANNNQIIGNYIGTQIDGINPLGNTFYGILADTAGTNNQVGGTATAEGNIIAFNATSGIQVTNTNGLAILGNSIFSNTDLGIELDDDLDPNTVDGVTPNDLGDGDTGGNRLQNFPILTSVTANGENITVNGTLNSLPNTQFRIEFFGNGTLDPSGYGEGQTYLGFVNVTTDAIGNVTFTSPAFPTSGLIVATATNLITNDTSEFSQTSPGSLQLSNPTYTVSEDATAIGATITINRIGGNRGAVSVNLEVADGTATASDYTNTPFIINFADGDTTPKTITIPITEDALDEANETINLFLKNPTGNATIGDPLGTAVLSIVDNDDSPTLSLTPTLATQSEGNSDTVDYTFTVNLSSASGQPITVDYATVDETAKAESDYLSATGTLIFSPGEVSKSLTIQAKGDTTNEAEETFQLKLSNPQQAVVSMGESQGAITNDDLPTVSVNNVNLVEGNGETPTPFIFQVTLSNATEIPVPVSYTTLDQSATVSDEDYLAKTGTLTFDGNSGISQAITIDVKGDRRVESNETFTVNLTSIGSSNASAIGTGTILNDDRAGVTITPSSLTVTEGGNSSSYSIQLNSQPVAPVRISVAAGNQINPIGNVVFDPINWNIPQPITVSALDDSLVEGSHTETIFPTVISSDLNYNQLAIALLTVNLVDNDVTPTPPPILPTATPAPTLAPLPTPSPLLAATPAPTVTPIPTLSPLPAATPAPTVTPLPTPSPLPAATPAPTLASSLSPSPNEECICQTMGRPTFNRPNPVDRILNGTGHSELEIGTDENEVYYGSSHLNLFNAVAGNDNLLGGEDKDIFNGNEGNDFIDGNQGDDRLWAGKDNDIVLGGQGQEIIFGNRGNDALHGKEDNDTLQGNENEDFLEGGKGNDFLLGGKDSDTLLGSLGEDSLWGNRGDDTLCGGSGNNYLSGNENNDSIDGCEGNDILYGGKGNDTLIGGIGNDILSGDLGSDRLIGGSGSDIFVLGDERQVDTIEDFSIGEDLIQFSPGLTLENLQIVSELGTTFMLSKTSGQILAILKGIATDRLTITDFTTA